MARAYVTLDDLLKLSHRAHGFSFLPRQPVHSLLTGRHASRLRGRGLDFDELRHYYEGDDTRTIDWAATARLGTPYVRVYREERDRSVLLLVDQRVSMFFGSRRATKSVVAAEVAALAAFRVASLGDRVGGIVFSEQGISEVAPQARQGGVRRLLGELVRHNSALRADVPHPADAEPVRRGAAPRRPLRPARLPRRHDLRRLGQDGRDDAAGDRSHRAQRRDRRSSSTTRWKPSCPTSAAPCWPKASTRSRSTCPAPICAAASPRSFAEGRAADRAHFSLTRQIPVLPIRTDLDVTAAAPRPDRPAHGTAA